MKYLIILISLIIVNTSSAQFLQKLASSYIKSNLNQDYAGLQLAPNLSEDELIQAKIQELLNLDKYFKYSSELRNDCFQIYKKENGFLIYILKKPFKASSNFLTEESAKNSLLKNNIKDVLEFNFLRNENYTSTILKEYKKYVKEKEYIASLDNQRTGLFDVNFGISPKIIIDKQIVNLSLINNNLPNLGKILNRNVATSNMKTVDHQPYQMFSDATAGIIIPHVTYIGSWGQEVRAKAIVLDKNWRRLVVFDKDIYTGEYGVPITRVFLENSNVLTNPNDITYGTKYARIWNEDIRDTIYPIYVADPGNNHLFEFKYVMQYNFDVNTANWNLFTTYLDETPTELGENLQLPNTLAFHPGVNSNNKVDDVLWYTEGNPDRRYLQCLKFDNRGGPAQTIPTITYAGTTYTLNVDRFSIYRSPDGLRNVMAVIDKNTNMLFVLKMTAAGLLDVSAPRFVVGTFNFGYQKLNSVNMISNNNGIDGTTIWAVADIGNGGCNGGAHCGCISTLKVSYLDNTPIKAEYLASSWGGFGSDNSFVDLRNIYSQNGFLDIFTLEGWNNNFGIRRFKPGVGVIAESHSDNYCYNSGYNIYVRLTNPAKCSFNAYAYINDCNEILVERNITSINVIISTNGIAYLGSGDNYINIKTDIVENLSTSQCNSLFRIKMTIIPQDESNYNSSNRIERTYDGGFGSCNSSGGCPFIYVNDGIDYKQDNNILHRSEFPENVGTDIVDKYKLNVLPAMTVDSLYEFKIKELNNDYSYFDNFKLKAYDHPIGTRLGVTENNDVILYFPSFVNSPTKATLDGVNVTDVLNYDSNYTKIVFGDDGSGLITDFDIPEPRANIILKANIKNAYLTCLTQVMRNTQKLKGKNKNVRVSDNTIIDSTALILDPSQIDGYIHLQSAKQDAAKLTAYDDALNVIADQKPIARRENRSTVFLPVGHDVKVDSATADWNRDFEMTFFAATNVFYGGFIENELELVAAENSVNGDMLDVLSTINTKYAEMDSTSEIILRFKNSLSTPEEGFVRDYVIETKGRYNLIEAGNRTTPVSNSINPNIPKEYKLHQNYPNPFNPTTNIRYDIPKSGFVSIKIYDILGKEVYSFSENKLAGFYDLQFNGSFLSSGIYFYRIETNNFVNTKRMVLVK